MGNSSSVAGTPVNSVPDREMPLNFPSRFQAGQGIEVAVSPDTRERPGFPGRRAKPVPTVFRWENAAAKQVLVAGSWDNFASRKPLVRSKSAHTLILEIPPGQNHRYIFYVDGKPMVDNQKPITANVQGEQYNMLSVEEVSEFTLSGGQTESSSPPGEYAQEPREPPPNPSRKRKNANEPPMLPPHLLRALLNSSQSQHNPLLLPVPHHVMLNHLYVNRAREKDGVAIYGVSCRFRNKFVTTVLYKPA